MSQAETSSTTSKNEAGFLEVEIKFSQGQLFANEKYLYICRLYWGISSVG